MSKSKPFFTAALIFAFLLALLALSACSSKKAGGDGDTGGSGQAGDGINSAGVATAAPIDAGAPLAREDFNFYDGSNIIDPDDDSGYGGKLLPEGMITGRGFKYGDDMQKFALLYDGLASIITVTDINNEKQCYPDAEISAHVVEISADNCDSVSFIFVNDGYTLTFDYSAPMNKFNVTARSPKDNGRSQAFDFLCSASQYILFGSYPELWPDTGHLPWVYGDIDEMEYLNERNELLNQNERVFMYEQAEAYLDVYGIPPTFEEQQMFFSSLSEPDREIFDRAGLKIWNHVRKNLP